MSILPKIRYYYLGVRSAREGDMRVRQAKPNDKKLVMRLASNYLMAVKDIPGAFALTNRTLATFDALFDLYVERKFDGVVLLVAQDAFLMQGEGPDNPYDTNFGKTAWCWGAFASGKLEDEGVYLKMQQRALVLLKAMGFDTVCGHAYGVDNTDDLDENIYSVMPPMVYNRLREPKLER